MPKAGPVRICFAACYADLTGQASPSGAHHGKDSICLNQKNRKFLIFERSYLSENYWWGNSFGSIS